MQRVVKEVLLRRLKRFSIEWNKLTRMAMTMQN
jgi:hypothetical protein